MGALRLSGFRCWRLQPIDLVIGAGECVTISGPSGAGKTLLLRAFADLDVHQGLAFLDAWEQRQLSGPEWRRRVAYLPAESHWWAERVVQHFAHNGTDLLGRLGFEPECLTWEVSRLSSGERQRLALARQLAQKPEALLLDEPTANLDEHNRWLVEQCVARYCEKHKAATLWISHDAAQRRRVSSRRFRLTDHRLVQEANA